MTTAAERRKLNRDAGFSLLELLIAVVILAIIVIPLLNLFLSSNRLNIKSRQTLRATTAAQDIMEGLKAYNMDELKTQFADPASGFYVIDSRLVKGGVAEETALEVDGSGNPAPGLYVFSMKELNLQGSKFDAKIVVDGRGYMDGTLTHDNQFNDVALANARSIDKDNGTFVETYRIRKAVLAGAYNHSDIETAVKAGLKAIGIPDDKLDEEFLKRKTDATFKNISSDFDKVARKIEVKLEADASDMDENGHPRVSMKVTQTYTFTCTYTDPAGAPVTKTVAIMGDMGSGHMVNDLDCGKITAMKDGSLNVNLFYYPLYGPAGKIGEDEIIIENESGAKLNLLIAKQRCDIGDPEYLTDQQLMQEEDRYHANVTIDGAAGPMTADQFTLRTNLGMNLAGKDFLNAQGRTSEYVNSQYKVNNMAMVAATPPAAGSIYHIFTLDGVRSPMGQPALPGEITELIYDVEVSLYKEGAAAAGFPDDERMVVIEGSMTN